MGTLPRSLEARPGIMDDRFDAAFGHKLPDAKGDCKNHGKTEDDRDGNHSEFYNLCAIQWRFIFVNGFLDGFVFPNGRSAGWAGLRRSHIERMTFDASD